MPMTQFQLIYDKLNYLGKKSEVHTDNLTRSELPNERAREIEPFKAKMAKSPSTLSNTNANHIQPGTSVGGVAYKISKVKPDELDIANNSISPEQQLMALNEANTQALALQRVHKADVSMIRHVYGVVR